MSHQIQETDNVLLRKQSAWHGLGQIVEDDLTAVEACEKSGIDWEVQGMPTYWKNPVTGEFHEINSHRANVRTIETPEGNVHKFLGMVGSGYEICQNRELAEFCDALSQTGEVVTETCGTLRDGKNVWFLCKADSYDFGGDVSHSYLLASNSHDGTRSIQLVPTDIRVVCANTLQAVIGDFESNNVKRAAISIRHIGDVSEKLVEARNALREYNEIKERNREWYYKMSQTKFDEDRAEDFFIAQYATSFQAYHKEAATEKVQERRFQRQMIACQKFKERLNREANQFGGISAWLALNAWTGYVQHDHNPPKNAEVAEKRQYSQLFGTVANRTSGALADMVAAVSA